MKTMEITQGSRESMKKKGNRQKENAVRKRKNQNIQTILMDYHFSFGIKENFCIFVTK